MSTSRERSLIHLSHQHGALYYTCNRSRNPADGFLFFFSFLFFSACPQLALTCFLLKRHFFFSCLCKYYIFLPRIYGNIGLLAGGSGANTMSARRSFFFSSSSSSSSSPHSPSFHLPVRLALCKALYSQFRLFMKALSKDAKENFRSPPPP